MASPYDQDTSQLIFLTSKLSDNHQEEGLSRAIVLLLSLVCSLQPDFLLELGKDLVFHFKLMSCKPLNRLISCLYSQSESERYEYSVLFLINEIVPCLICETQCSFCIHRFRVVVNPTLIIAVYEH